MASVNATAAAAWLHRLQERLDQREEAGLLRHLADTAPVSSDVIDLRHNDYLGLRRHPAVADAMLLASSTHGAGSGASRLLADDETLRQFEARWATFKQAEAALLLPTGYMANIAAINGIAMSGDLILLDRLCHASLLDAARLASAANPRVTWRTFPHQAVGRAGDLARRHIARHPDATVILVSEALFSMDGDLADLAALGALRDEINDSGHGGACVVLDEAHAVGVIGPGGAGLDAAAGRIADVLVATGGKSLGVMGGMIAGPTAVIESVVNFARPLVYSTGVMPAQAAALKKSLSLLERESWRIERLGHVIRDVRNGLREGGWLVESPEVHPTPIVPLVVGEAESAVSLSESLARQGILAPAIRPPTVPRSAARVRLSLNSGLSDEMIERVVKAVNSCGMSKEQPTRPTDLLS